MNYHREYMTDREIKDRFRLERHPVKSVDASDDPYACVNALGEVYPEHDFTENGTCARCDAEAYEDDEVNDYYDEIADRLRLGTED